MRGYLSGGPQNKDYSVLGSILGSLTLGNYYMYMYVCRTLLIEHL